MANEQNLIPNSQRTARELSEMGAKGGRAVKGLVRYGQTKCRNCKLPCPVKQEGIKEDSKCKVPDAKRIILEAFLNPNKLTEKLFMNAMELDLIAGTSFKNKKETFEALLSLKKEINPNIQPIGLVNLSEGLSAILEIAQENGRETTTQGMVQDKERKETV